MLSCVDKKKNNSGSAHEKRAPNQRHQDYAAQCRYQMPLRYGERHRPDSADHDSLFEILIASWEQLRGDEDGNSHALKFINPYYLGVYWIAAELCRFRKVQFVTCKEIADPDPVSSYWFFGWDIAFLIHCCPLPRAVLENYCKTIPRLPFQIAYQWFFFCIVAASFSPSLFSLEFSLSASIKLVGNTKLKFSHRCESMIQISKKSKKLPYRKCTGRSSSSLFTISFRRVKYPVACKSSSSPPITAEYWPFL